MTDQHDSQKQSTFDQRWQRVGTQYNAGHNITIHEADTIHDVRGLANPYLGLAAFTHAERAKYAGRSRQIREAVAKLTTPGEQQVLLFVTGASGSGKSSFAQAGLIPALEHYYAQRHQIVRRAVFRPSKQPLAMLADVLQQFGIRAAHPGLPYQTFYRLLKKHTEARQVNVIIIDQFEELFTQSDPLQRDVLVALLVRIPTFIELRTHLIATIRADYLPEVFHHRALYDQTKHGIDLRGMTKDELKQAIQQPLHQHPTAVDKRFEDALLDKLAADAATDAAYLPLLQATLARLWGGGLLKLSAYDSLADAIQQQAEDVYVNGSDGSPRPDAEQRAILTLLLELVDVSPMGDDRRDVRRRRTLNELLHAAPERRPLVTELATARLLSTGHETRLGNDVETVDIIHESLLNNWPRLRAAIDAERETLQQRARFELALHEWQENAHTDSYLLEGRRLASAEDLAVQGDVALRNAEAQELLKRSVTKREAERKRQLRRVQVVAMVLAVLLVLAVGAGWFAFEQQQVAQQNAADAQVESNRAAGLAVASAAQAELAQNNLDLAYPLVLAAAQMSQPAIQAKELLVEAIYTPGTIRQFTGHTGLVNSVVFSSDGKQAISASNDNTLRQWDITTGMTIRTFYGHTGAVSSVAISPDGQYILSGSYDRTLRLWNIASGETIRTFTGNTDSVRSVALSPDGKLALSGSADATLRLWNVSSGQELQRFTTTTGLGVVNDVAFSPDGKYAISSSTDMNLRLWDMASGKEIRVFSGHGWQLSSVAFSPNGKYVLSGSIDRTLRLWDITNGETVRSFTGHKGYVQDVAFSPDGNYILSGASDYTLRVWDMASGETIHVFTEHPGNGVRSVVFSPDGKYAISGSENGTLRLWDIERLTMLHTIEGYTQYVNSVAFSDDGRYVLSGSNDHMLRLWNADSGELIRTFIGHTEAVTSVAFSPDGKYILSCSQDGTLRLWNTASGATIYTISGSRLTVREGTYSHDGKLILAVFDNDTIRIWDAATKEPIHSFTSPSEEINSIAISSDTKSIISGLFDGTLLLWDVGSGEVIRTFTGHTKAVTSVAFSPDGKYILSGSSDYTLRLWDVRNGDIVHIFTGHTFDITSVAFSPDGKTALSGSADETLRLWDIEDGELIREFTGHSGDVSSVAFSPDGQTALSGSGDIFGPGDSTLRFWKLVPIPRTEQFAWLCSNRYIPEIHPSQRKRYGIPDDLVVCPAIEQGSSSEAGVAE